MAQSTLEERFAVPQQTKTEKMSMVYPYNEVDIYPYYNDGIEEFYKLFSKELWVPSGVREKANHIRISIIFIVERDGSLSNIDSKVSSYGPKVSEGLREEIIKAMKKMPNWVPGKVNGEYVRVKIMIPYSLSIKVHE